MFGMTGHVSEYDRLEAELRKVTRERDTAMTALEKVMSPLTISAASSAELAALRAQLAEVTRERDAANDNARYILDSVLPKSCVVRVCEGGGPENIQASLAVSILKALEPKP